MARPELTVVVPGLLASDAVAERRELLSGLTLDALERLLGRAEAVPRAERGLEAALFELFEVPFGGDGGAPVAPLTLLHDSGEVPEGIWLRADPVAVRATQDRLIMVGGSGLALESGEAQALCAELNDHFSDEGWGLISPVPGRWYLKLAAPPEARFVPLPEVIGADIHPNMPSGPRARYWRATLNETQMVLHASEANRHRSAAGRTEVNSLWFWGAGAWPGPAPRTAAPRWSQVWAEGPLAGGLAMRAGIPHRGRPRDAAGWLEVAGQGGRHLILLDELREPARLCDVERWRDGLQALHEAWFAPLHAALKDRRLAALTLCAVDGMAGAGQEGAGQVFRGGAVDYHVTPKLLRRWWRRPRSVADPATGNGPENNNVKQ